MVTIIDSQAVDKSIWKHARYDYFRFVEMQDGNEIGELAGITGGTITKNYLTALKYSGKIKYNYKIDRGWIDKDIRVYMYSVPKSNQDIVVKTLLGTFRTTTPKVTLGQGASSYQIVMYSMLIKLQNQITRQTLTVPAGTNVIDYVANLCDLSGLPVRKVDSNFVLSTDKTWDSGVTYIDVCNDLLGMANYNSVGIDRYGNAVLTPYVDPASKAPTYVFSDDDEGIVMPDIDVEWDVFDTPNVVLVKASDANGEMNVTVVNDDPTNPFSTVNRGMEIPYVLEVDYLDTEENLIAKGRRQLSEYAQSVEAYLMEHLFVDIESGDTVEVDFTSLGVKQIATMHSMDIELRPGAKTKSRIRWFKPAMNA